MHVGEETAFILSEHFRSIDAIVAASELELNTVPMVGPKISTSIKEFFLDSEAKTVVAKLQNAGVTFRHQSQRSASGKLIFDGDDFAVTGTLSTMTRLEFEELVRKAGGTISKTVGRKTKYLVLGEDPGSKIIKARELGILQISEEEFLAKLADI